MQLLFYIKFICMAAVYFIWIIWVRIRLNRKRYPKQSKSKKFLVSGGIGLKNPDPVHHWCKPNSTMTSERAVSFLRTVAWHVKVVTSKDSACRYAQGRQRMEAWRGNCPSDLSKGATEMEVPLHNSIIGNFMVYQDRPETNLLQLFGHPENSEWFSIIFVIIFQNNIDGNRNKHNL